MFWCEDIDIISYHDYTWLDLYVSHLLSKVRIIFLNLSFSVTFYPDHVIRFLKGKKQDISIYLR